MNQAKKRVTHLGLRMGGNSLDHAIIGEGEYRGQGGQVLNDRARHSLHDYRGAGTRLETLRVK